LICDDPEYAKQVVDEVFSNREVSFSLWLACVCVDFSLVLCKIFKNMCII
jgi:hypothetical protein